MEMIHFWLLFFQPTKIYVQKTIDFVTLSTPFKVSEAN